MKPEEINRRCAEFMGWEVREDDKPTIKGAIVVEKELNDTTLAMISYEVNFYENISDAWMVVEKAKEKGILFALKQHHNHVTAIFYDENGLYKESDETAPMAICKAVLKLEGNNG